MDKLRQFTDEELFDALERSVEDELKERGYKYGWHRPVKYAGEIYVLVNPAFPNLVKIGYADNVERRVKTLNSNPGLPDPYHIYATYKVKKRLEDLKLHGLIDSLDPSLRHVKNREFYEMAPEKAFGILSAIAQINGDEELLKLNPLHDEFFREAEERAKEEAEKKKATPKARRLTFKMLGIEPGEEIVFKEDETVRPVVASEDRVSYDGQIWKLSGLVKELKRRSGTATPSEAYQGGLYFTYKGSLLTDIRKGLESEVEEGSNGTDN